MFSHIYTMGKYQLWMVLINDEWDIITWRYMHIVHDIYIYINNYTHVGNTTQVCFCLRHELDKRKKDLLHKKMVAPLPLTKVNASLATEEIKGKIFSFKCRRTTTRALTIKIFFFFFENFIRSIQIKMYKLHIWHITYYRSR